MTRYMLLTDERNTRFGRWRTRTLAIDETAQTAAAYAALLTAAAAENPEHLRNVRLVRAISQTADRPASDEARARSRERTCSRVLCYLGAAAAAQWGVTLTGAAMDTGQPLTMRVALVLLALVCYVVTGALWKAAPRTARTLRREREARADRLTRDRERHPRPARHRTA